MSRKLIGKFRVLGDQAERLRRRAGGFRKVYSAGKAAVFVKNEFLDFFSIYQKIIRH